MRLIVTFILCLGMSAQSFAQEDIVDILLPLKAGQRVSLNLRFADKIEVKTWDKKQLSIHASIIINDGLLNDAHEIDTMIVDGQIKITTDFDEEMIRGSKYNNCEGKNRSQHNFSGRRDRNYSICHTITYTVFLPAETDLEVETISGDILIEKMTSKVDAKSISGLVDVTIGRNQKADVILESVTGRAYTEPAMFQTKDGLQSLLSRKVSGELNGGGNRIHLESVSGNVRLRQAN